MNALLQNTFAGHLALSSGLVLTAGFLLHFLLRSRSAAWQELVWRSAFIVLLLLPLAWAFRPFALFEEPPLLLSAPMAVMSPADVTPDMALPTLPPTVIEPFPWEMLLGAIWAAGAFVLLLRVAAGMLWRRRWRTGATSCQDPSVLELWQQIDPHTDGQLLVSPDCRVPLTWGKLVILPIHSLAWSRENLAAALHHEAAHLQRRDSSYRGLGEIAAAFFWPQPLVWLARRLWHRTQEQACDDAVLRSGSDPANYAELLCAAARMWTRPVTGGLSMAQPSSLECRLRAVLDPERPRSPCTPRSLKASGFAILLAFATSALAQKQERKLTVHPDTAVAKTAYLIPDVSFPSLKFLDKTLEGALVQISKEIAELPQGRNGLRVATDPAVAGRQITMEIRDVKLESLLRIFAQATNSHIINDGNGIVFKDGPAVAPAPAVSHSALRKLALGILFDALEFEEATVADMVDEIMRKIRQAKFPGQPIDIILQFPPSTKYSLSLKNVTAWDAVAKVAEISGMSITPVEALGDRPGAIRMDVYPPNMETSKSLSDKIKAIRKTRDLLNKATGDELIEVFSKMDTGNATINNFSRQYKKERIEYARMLKSGFGINHPKVIGLRKQIEEERKILLTASGNYRESLAVTIKNLETKSKKLEQAVK